jgi:hypothetical protein
MSIDELIKELLDKINRILSLYFLKTEGKTEITPPETEYKAPPEKVERPPERVEYVEYKEYKPSETRPEKIEIETRVETKREEKPPCHLRGEGYPWDWIDCGISGYMNCLDQILGAFPDSRLACGVLVYLYKNNMINDYCCHRYCVNCDSICFGWANELIKGNRINGHCDNQGNCYANGVLVYPFDKEYVKSTNDQILISALRQLGCW